MLPDEIKIPAGMTDTEEISDYITDATGFCHKGNYWEIRDIWEDSCGWAVIGISTVCNGDRTVEENQNRMAINE